MKKTIILTLIILVFYSCKTDRKPRTIYWSASRFENYIRDTVHKPKLHLGYYIEISDNGDAKLMTRKNFNAPKEFYKIKIPDSLINQIFNLTNNDSLFIVKKLNNNESAIYDGPTYYIQYSNDSTKKEAVYEPYRSNLIQGKMQRIMKSILINPVIICNTQINLIEYEKQVEETINKNYPPIKILIDKEVSE
ncbi:MAG: hypothetical protein WCK02_04335 [Bacteroidota bacterium]